MRQNPFIGGPQAGDLPFIGPNDQIDPISGSWVIDGRATINHIWNGLNRVAGPDDILAMNISGGLPNGTDLSTAMGTIVFPIPFASITLPFSGPSITGGADIGTWTLQAVPIPSAMLLFGSGLAALGAWRHRKGLKT